jgi:hypothetical protein
MGETFGGPVCLEREQPMWVVLLAPLVSWFNGRQRVRLRLWRGDCERIVGESAGVPPGMAEEGLSRAVAGVPDGAFTLS